MKFLVMSYALAAMAAQSVDGTEVATKPLQLQTPKAALAAAPVHGDAPFVAPPAASTQDLVAPRLATRRDERSRSSCQSDRDLCYDPNSGRIVYKPARQFMPDIPGLRPENISVRRDRIVFRYSF